FISQARVATADRSDEMSVESVGIEGPFHATGTGDTPSRRQLFVCLPASAASEEPCAKRILSRLARRAYRRPVTDADLQSLLGFYRAGRREQTFDAGIQAALERLLVSPSFLLRIEGAPAARPTDIDLASRVSF